MAEITLHRGEVLDELRPLWLALRAHHDAVMPDFAPVRDEDDSWARRRRQYEGWLEDDDAFVLLARRDGAVVGYAFVRPDEHQSPTWVGRGREAVLETLSLLPEARGAGLGAAMVARVREECAARGIARVVLFAVAGNTEARRFYEREGFREFAMEYVMDMPGTP